MTQSTKDFSGTPSRRTRRDWLRWLAAAVVAVVLAHVFDAWAWEHIRDTRINDKDLGRLLRSFGYLPTWLIIAGALWLQDHGKPQWGWRGGMVLLAPIAGGAVAEVLKLVVRRLRPDPEVFAYVFRPFAEHALSNRGLGMPSSHTMVAFAGATMMARLFPRAWWLWYLVAGGCAVTRVLAVGHFLSDVVVAALLGYIVGELLTRTRGFSQATTS